METMESDDDVIVLENEPKMQIGNVSNGTCRNCTIETARRQPTIGLRVIKEACLMAEDRPLDLSLSVKRPLDNSSPAGRERKKYHLSAIPNLAPAFLDKTATSQNPVVNLSDRTAGQQQEMNSLNNPAFNLFVEPPAEVKMPSRDFSNFQPSPIHPSGPEFLTVFQSNLLNQKRFTEAAALSFASFPFGYLYSWMKSMEQRRLEDLRNMEYLRNRLAVLTRQMEISQHQQQPNEKSANCGQPHHPANSLDLHGRSSNKLKAEDSTETPVPERGAVEPINVETNQSDFYDDEDSADEDDDTESTEPNEGDHIVGAKRNNPHDEEHSLPEELDEFIENCRLTMKARGLTYSDVLAWTKSRFYLLNVCKISQFMNRKLSEAKSREMMAIMKEFLQHEPKLSELDNVELSEEVERFIDESRTTMLNRGLSGMDFVSWTKDHFPFGLQYSSVGLFMNKKLNEEKSRAMMPILKLFLEDESVYRRRLRRTRVRERFSPEQVVILTESLRKSMYPSGADIEELAKRLRTTRIRIKRWFMNKRQKFIHGK